MPFIWWREQKKARFCVHCGNPSRRKRRIRFTSRYVLFAVISLILAGAISYVLAGGLESRLVGKVNGEEITRQEFSKRLERAKKFYELRYGQNLFHGQEGKENLNRLKTEILNEMTTEKILLQEAKGTGYSSAPEEEIQKEVEDIKKKCGLSEADLEQKMGESIEDLKEELRKGWIISQLVEKMAGEILERIGLRGKGKRLPDQLSGGEQERVAIVRALVNSPPILMADEPTGNLDSKNGKEIMELFETLNKEGQTIVMVTHNPENASSSTRTISLRDGKLG